MQQLQCLPGHFRARGGMRGRLVAFVCDTSGARVCVCACIFARARVCVCPVSHVTQKAINKRTNRTTTHKSTQTPKTHRHTRAITHTHTQANIPNTPTTTHTRSHTRTRAHPHARAQLQILTYQRANLPTHHQAPTCARVGARLPVKC